MAIAIKDIPVLKQQVAESFVDNATKNEKKHKGGKVDTNKLARVRELLARSK
ncbi:MAG: hypothetical protein ACPGLV_13355 [Bacteroidia bacterium]